jgi:cellulose synthase/poly-beta-1,6-N-acetylglucosamine synthase-like glycosyltransferase
MPNKLNKNGNKFFEMIPALLSWTTIVAMFVLSYFFPIAVAFFVIFFDTYWLMKSVYLVIHAYITYAKMRENLNIDWRGKLEGSLISNVQCPVRDWREIYHLVIYPMYREPYEVVRESFDSLAKTDYPRDKFIVVLTCEARAGEEAMATARRIEKEYGSKFFKFLVTSHPADLEGEIPGKGSNEAWAGTEAKKAIIDPLHIPYENIIASVFDVDTQIPSGFFSRLTYQYATVEKPLRAIYQPLPLFTNNIYESPALARVIAFSSTFWQMMQQSRPRRLTSFSSQSIPFKTLVDIGFWERDIVGEDSRTFWQSLLKFDGDFRVEPMLYPVSMDVNVGPTIWITIKNLYLQQRRWAWGSEDVPYLINNFLKNKKIKIREKLYWLYHLIEGFHSWATNAIMLFSLGWLPIMLGGRAFNNTLLSYSLPKVTNAIMSFSIIGIATSMVLNALLLPAKPERFRKYQFIYHFLQWLLVPFIYVFLAFPALDAQTRLAIGGKWRLGFWPTPKLRKQQTRVSSR